jgi:YHS domain-containing protein
MSTYNLRLAMALAATLTPSLAWGQQGAHQPASTPAGSVELTQCLRVQPVIASIITAATSRAEAARLSNSPTDMRAALESLEAALRDIRAQSAPCSTVAASAEPHAGHAMPSTQPSASTPPAKTPAGAADPHAGHSMPSAAPASTGVTIPKPAPSKPSKPAAASPHSGHTMPSAAPASKRATTPNRTPSTTSRPAGPDAHAGHTPTAAPATKPAPAATKPPDSKSADPHAAHSSVKPDDKQRDPVNGLIVDPATAPKTTYQGRTYYFSSEQSLKQFLESPAKYAKPPKK